MNADEPLEDLALERSAFDVGSARFDLFAAATLVGRIEGEPIDTEAVDAGIDELVEQVRNLLPVGGGFEEHLDAVLQVLFVDEGFSGNHKSYHDPANSFLHRVLETRRGIPITLSLITVEVARRSGLPAMASPSRATSSSALRRRAKLACRSS